LKKKVFRFGALLGVIAFATPAMAAQHWGSFRDDGCVKYKEGKYRVFKSVLWGIPWGHSWEVACSKMPATITLRKEKVHFTHPTACVKASVVDALSITGAVLGVGGVAYPPAGVVGAVLGVTTVALDKSGGGGINMWGVFYVQDPKCR
jgi:hypothetical protein